MKFYVMVLGFVFLWGTNAFGGNPFEEKSYEAPVREVSIIATEDGFYPNKVMAFTGERLKFFITSTAGNNQCFILQKHDVFVSAEKGKINEAHVQLDNPGRFKFYCPSTNYVGHLTVFEKFKQEEEASRAPASSKPKHWMPRDFD